MNNYERSFRTSAVLILALTAVAKLISATGKVPLLDFPDPLFGLTNRHLMLLVGLVELGVGAVLVSNLDLVRKHLLLVWLSSSFLLYRLGYWAINPGQPCPCLGTLTDRLGLSSSTSNLLLSGIVIYLLAGSVCFLFLPRRRTQCTG